MPRNLKPGDRVRWNTSQGETSGRVEKKLTSETHIKRHVAKPTEDDTEYLVRSSKSGKLAAHRPERLKKEGLKKE